MQAQPANRTPKQRLLFSLAGVLAAAHLVFVFLSALHLPTPSLQHAPGQLAYVYGRWTGANSRYSFFAPNIAPPMRVLCDVGLDSGEWVQDGFDFDNEALKIRAYAMSLRFNGMSDKNVYKDDVARAWAAIMFGRYPEAHGLSVRMERMRVPTMEEFRAGERPSWSQTYRADFELRPSSSPAQASNP